MPTAQRTEFARQPQFFIFPTFLDDADLDDADVTTNGEEVTGSPELLGPANIDLFWRITKKTTRDLIRHERRTELSLNSLASERW